MKHIKFGNMLNVEHGILVHGCNAQGVMGSGIALAVKTKYPAAFDAYRAACASLKPEERLGKSVFVNVSDYIYVANCITQFDFGKDGRKYVNYQAIQQCFTDVAAKAKKDHLDVHYPLIGAGLGGGDWAVISNIIDAVFAKHENSHLNHTLWIYE